MIRRNSSGDRPVTRTITPSGVLISAIGAHQLGGLFAHWCGSGTRERAGFCGTMNPAFARTFPSRGPRGGPEMASQDKKLGAPAEFELRDGDRPSATGYGYDRRPS